MSKQKIISKYIKNRDKIMAKKNITEATRNTELFVNWKKYIDSFVEISKKEEIHYIKEKVIIYFNYKYC